MEFSMALENDIDEKYEKFIELLNEFEKACMHRKEGLIKQFPKWALQNDYLAYISTKEEIQKYVYSFFKMP